VRKVIILATVVLAVQPSASGQVDSTIRSPWQIGIGLSFTYVKDLTAEKVGVAAHGWGFDFFLGCHFHKMFPITLDFGYESFGDKQQFKQFTVGTGPGAYGEKSSTITMGFISLAVGFLTPRIYLDNKPDGIGFSIGVNVGYDAIGFMRHIDQCIDCTSEDINISGYNYFEPTLQLYFSRRNGIGFYYRSYADRSDLIHRWMIKYVYLSQ
jgi:hypothetical protein